MLENLGLTVLIGAVAGVGAFTGTSIAVRLAARAVMEAIIAARPKAEVTVTTSVDAAGNLSPMVSTSPAPQALPQCFADHVQAAVERAFQQQRVAQRRSR